MRQSPAILTDTLDLEERRQGVAADLAFEQTVRRSLVHKRLLENVLLTDFRAVGGDRFLCAGRLPNAHRFFNQSGRIPRQDVLYYTELGRQASLAVSHAFLDVCADDVFIFEGSHAAISDAALNAEHRSATLDPVFVEIRIEDITRRRNAVNRVVAEHIMTIGGEEVFRGTGAWTVQTAALFQRLRRMSNTRPAPLPANVAPFPSGRGSRAAAEHAVITMPEPIANDAVSATLIVDDADPYFFDHPCDHVPGMLLLEACAQIALSATARLHESRIRSYEVNFAQFVECSIPTTLTARRIDADTVDISISQQDAVCGTTRMTVVSAS